MKKNILDKNFIHNSWFKGQGVTRKFALDYFAESNRFVLGQKRSRKQSMELLGDIVYDDIITDGHSSYKLCEEEKEYYIERKKYYDEQKKIEEEKWLNSEVDFKKEINIFLGDYDYDIKHSKHELETCLNKYSTDVDTINYWKEELEKATKIRTVIDNIIANNKDKIKTNKDFIWLKNKIEAIEI